MAGLAMSSLDCRRLAQSAEPGKGEIDGTVSSFSPSAAGFVTGIPSNVAVEIKTAAPGSSITKDVPVLRADYAAGQARLSGVREVDQRRFP